MTNATKLKTKFNGRVSVRILCSDCAVAEIRQTVEAGIYSEESAVSQSEMALFAFPSCDVCEASFAVAAVR
jgi:hypothetical protein